MSNRQQRPVYEFPPFRLDAAERLLLRNGEVVNLTPKSFDLLCVLVEHPGGLLTKDELLQAVWPDAFVEEGNLADNISKLRKALGDGDNGHNFIETVPKRGYRFAACVREVVSDNKEKVYQGQQGRPASHKTEEKPWLRHVLSRFLVQVRRRKFVTDIIVLAIALVVIWVFNNTIRHAPPIERPRPLRQLTFDGGLTAAPTWSSDGRMIAYSSDRSGNFDIWVQSLSEGDPVQVTRSSAHDWQPDWSPDGRKIAFRSERNGGGLFVVPALGGVERKITDYGYLPRWSPDGSQILFSSSALQFIGDPPRLYVVAVDGGPPREVLGAFFSKIKYEGLAGYAWYPDGRSISVWAEHKEFGRGFWTLPISGAEGIKSEIPLAVEQRLKDSAVTLGNFLWAPSRRFLYFVSLSQGVRDIWRVTVEPRTLRWTGGPDRLTTGAGKWNALAVSPDGTKLALALQHESTRVWSLPFNPVSHEITGDGKPETPAGIDAWCFDVTRDGKQLAFVTPQADKGELNASPQIAKDGLWKKSLTDGKETLLMPADEFFRLFPRWSPDGKKLAYSRMRLLKPGTTEREWLPVLIPADGGEEQVIGTGLTGIGDWSADGHWILGPCSDLLQGRYKACLAPVSESYHLENPVRVLAADPNTNFNPVRFSPDQCWIAIQAISYGGISAIYVMPASGGALKPITDGKHWDDHPRWAPDERTLYFVSDRGGFLNVWGIGFDPAKGQAIGDAFTVTRYESPSLMVFPKIAPLNMDITADRLFLNLSEISGSIWVLDNVDR